MATLPEPTLVEFVRYDHWATQQLLTLCMNLNEALLSADIPGTYGSILKTFGHLLRAQAEFLERIHGSGTQLTLKWEENQTLTQMGAFADQLGEAFLNTIQHVSPTKNVHEENDIWSFDYHARLIFMSQIYHGIAHRSDITTFLNNHGVVLPELDVWAYQKAYPDRFQAKLVKVAENLQES
ncbi:MAG: hypothetical protein KDE51_04550 [Anaerolineales bacterium]|nr:hypothetical protein [Anaerolineales bacterium]